MSKAQWALVGLVLLLGIEMRDAVPVRSSNSSDDAVALPTPSKERETVHLQKVKVAGVRLEGTAYTEEAVVLGFNQKHATVIKAGSTVRAILFGTSFQDIGAVTFTSDGTCTDLAQFLESDFSSLTSTRLVFELPFPETSSDTATYKLCVSEKFFNEPRFAILEDPFTMVTTEIPPIVNFLPYYMSVPLVIFLLLLSGLFSGLNLGLMALSVQELQLYIASGTEMERWCAREILPLRKKGNQLLCTLLLGNVIVNVGISMLLDSILGSGVIVMLVASLGIVIFGEIVPQALCVKWGLLIGAKTAKVTTVLFYLTYFITYPIARVLDLFLKEELTSSLERKKLMEMVRMSDKSQIGGQSDEFKMVLGALELYDKTVEHAMTKFDDIFSIPTTLALSPSMVTQILEMGYTRIPVFEIDPHMVVALLFVKDLALLDPEDEHNVMQIANIYKHEVRRVLIDMPLRNMLEEFKKGEYHMALVEKLVEQEDKDPVYELCGLITLEDIIEEIIQCEILDETDAVSDNVHKKKRLRKKNHDMSQFVNHKNAKCVINIQLLVVAIQFMSTCHKIFSPQFILPTVLEKLIMQNCKKVEKSQFSCLKAVGLVQPKPAVLYKKGEFSDKFILIFSGRAVITIGKEDMKLEAKAWHKFGTEVLDAMVDAIAASQSLPDQSTVSLNTDIANKKIGFIPDFDAEIAYDCIFCEISASELLAAYNSSQIQQLPDPPARSNSTTSVFEVIDNEKSTPVHNGRLRTQSENEYTVLLPNNKAYIDKYLKK